MDVRATERQGASELKAYLHERERSKPEAARSEQRLVRQLLRMMGKSAMSKQLDNIRREHAKTLNGRLPRDFASFSDFRAGKLRST